MICHYVGQECPFNIRSDYCNEGTSCPLRKE